jgi:hypothetical protein
VKHLDKLIEEYGTDGISHLLTSVIHKIPDEDKNKNGWEKELKKVANDLKLSLKEYRESQD